VGLEGLAWGGSVSGVGGIGVGWKCEWGWRDVGGVEV